MTSRRAFLAGLPAAGALVALPAMAATDSLSVAAMPEATLDRLDRLMLDLSETLDGYLGGNFRAIVEPYSRGSPAQLQNMRADANLQWVADVPAAPGHAVMTIGKRLVTVDTDALPQQLQVVAEDSRTDALPEGVVEFVTMPERGAEYVAVTHDGRIVITKLEPSLGSKWKRERRIGFMRGRWEGYRASYQVTVLGKVVGP